jgi:hypothetical protein
MISLVGIGWVNDYFPHKKLLSVKDFLQNDTLNIRAANSTDIPFNGVLLFNLNLLNDNDTVTVPFLVTSLKINEPILGYNVIEHLGSQ